MIYCFAISIVSKPLNHSDFRNDSSSSQEKYFSDFSTKFFCDTSQSENSVNNYNNLPSFLGFKSPFNELSIIIKITEQLLETAFYQYTNISINFLIEHRKTDIIFPFHYFW